VGLDDVPTFNQAHDGLACPEHIGIGASSWRGSRVQIEGTELSDDFRGVDGHAMGNSSRSGRICLLNAALTV